MKLFEAYRQALDEEDDPLERAEFTNSVELKTLVVEELMTAMKEIRDNRISRKPPLDMIKPMFDCVAFFFIIGIRVGKILRDKEIKNG